MQAADFYEQVGKRIRALREAAGWTQEQLAASIGIPTSSMNRYERGRRAVTLEIVRRVAIRLNVAPSVIIDVGGHVPTSRPDIPPPSVKRPLITRKDETAMLAAWRSLAPKYRKIVPLLLNDLAKVDRKRPARARRRPGTS